MEPQSTPVNPQPPSKVAAAEAGGKEPQTPPKPTAAAPHPTTTTPPPPPQSQAITKDSSPYDSHSLLPPETQNLLAYLEKLGDACSARQELQHQHSTGNYNYEQQTKSPGPSNPQPPPPASPPPSSSTSSFLTAAELSQLSVRVSNLSSNSLPADFLSMDER